LPLEQFLKRMAQTVGIALLLLVASLGIGMAGYHFTDQISWLDAFVNASMILTGMGPVDPLRGTAAKLFAGCYAIFSGVVFLSTVAVLLAPVAHRVLHRFHLEMDSSVPGP
jgi:hypothetical protein